MEANGEGGLRKNTLLNYNWNTNYGNIVFLVLVTTNPKGLFCLANR
jgi:hypothetical protein